MTLTTGADGGMQTQFTIDTLTGGTAAGELGSCSTSGLHLVYQVTIPAGSNQDLFVRAERPAGNITTDPVVYIRNSPCATGTEVACQDSAAAATPEVITAAGLAPGTYFVFIDSYTATSAGPTLVTMALTPTSPAPTNDTCATPTDILTGAMTTNTVTVNTASAAADYVGTCASTATTGKDVVYHLNLTVPRQVVFTSVGAGTADPVIYIRSTPCATGVEFPGSCKDSTFGGGTETVTLNNVPAGDYYLFVDSYSAATSGSQTVTVTLNAPVLPPTNDLCTAPTDVLVGAATSQTIAGTTTAANNNYAPACTSGNAGLDVVYRFTTTSAQKFTAKVTPTSPTSILVPSLHLREAAACQTDAGFAPRDGGFSNAPGCMNAQGIGEGDTLVVDSLPVGTYLLVVDSPGGSSGDFSLQLNLAAPLATSTNGTCATASTLAFTSGEAVVEGNTKGGTNNHAGTSCSVASSATNNDLVYKFTTPAGGADGGVNARIMAVSENATEVSPAAYLRSQCADAGSQINCVVSSQNTYTSMFVQQGLLPATDYFVWVDSSAATASGPAGPFQLTVDVAGAAPANDACTSATALPINTTVAGSTLSAKNDYSSTNMFYGGTGCAVALPGPDVAYSFTTTTAGTYTVRVVPQHGFDIAVAVLSACAISSCLANTDANNPSDPETIVVTGTAITTYYVIVDSYTTTSAGRGGFTVSVAH